jgi:hypothetical protein
VGNTKVLKFINNRINFDPISEIETIRRKSLMEEFVAIERGTGFKAH